MDKNMKDAEALLRSIDLSPWRQRIVKAAVVVLAILVITVLVIPKFLKKVGPGEVGGKTVNIPVLAKEKGVQKKVYGPGNHFVLPGAETLDVFDVTIQTHNMLRIAASSQSPHDQWVRIKMSDGNDVYVDVTILYQIKRDEAWRIRSDIGLGDALLEKKVKPEARSVIRSVLGELSTEKFYDSAIRQKKVEKARDLLDARLEPNGARALAVLIRDYEFTDSLEKAIREKKLADQMILVNKAEEGAARELAQRDKVIAEGEAAANVERARGQTEAQKIAAEADLILKQKQAEGDLAVRLAEAEGQRLLNEALAAKGSKNLVALDFAKALEGVDTVVLSSSGQHGVNPLDVNSIMATLGVPPETGGK
ncbi:MAG: hypothetical protein J7M12_06930 [Candidatus Hydrogenedentes bacterium]|nr:hypothetical protein [Candidatus Hydrogenedentota bacterium]